MIVIVMEIVMVIVTVLLNAGLHAPPEFVGYRVYKVVQDFFHPLQ